MKMILRNWNIARFIRLVLGIIVIIQGIINNEWVFALAGGLLILMAVANAGCCAASGCSVPVKSKSVSQNEINYEEMGPSK